KSSSGVGTGIVAALTVGIFVSVNARHGSTFWRNSAGAVVGASVVGLVLGLPVGKTIVQNAMNVETVMALTQDQLGPAVATSCLAHKQTREFPVLVNAGWS